MDPALQPGPSQTQEPASPRPAAGNFWRRAALTGILLLFIAQVLAGIFTHAVTVDEFVDLPLGCYHLKTRAFDLDRRNPPLLKMLVALPAFLQGAELDTDPAWRGDGEGWYPWIFSTRFMRLNREHWQGFFVAGRFLPLLLALVAGWAVHAWARQAYGRRPALAVALLAATCPTVIAHSGLATLDIGVSSLLFLAFFCLHAATTSRSASRHWLLILTGVFVGLAFCAKYVTLLLLPLIPLFLLFPEPHTAAGGEPPSPWRQRLLRLLMALGLLASGAWVAVNFAYLFRGFPFPREALAGILLKIKDSSTGEFPAYLCGEWSPRGWWYYYFACLWYKTPLPLLFLLIAGAVLLGRDLWLDTGIGRRRAAWLLLPPLFFLAVISHYRVNYGIRYLLPAFPFLFLVCGRAVDAMLAAGRRPRLLLGVLLAWQAVSVLSGTPHQLAYFNAMAGNGVPLLDSNFDWGQDLGRVAEYMRRRGLRQIYLGYFGHADPHQFGISYALPPPVPSPGIYAVSANYLAGYPYAITWLPDRRIAPVPPGVWSWLGAYEPVAVAGRSIMIFEIPEGSGDR